MSGWYRWFLAGAVIAGTLNTLECAHAHNGQGGIGWLVATILLLSAAIKEWSKA